MQINQTSIFTTLPLALSFIMGNICHYKWHNLQRETKEISLID